jgi:hypothetical protein
MAAGRPLMGGTCAPGGACVRAREVKFGVDRSCSQIGIEPGFWKQQKCSIQIVVAFPLVVVVVTEKVINSHILVMLEIYFEITYHASHMWSGLVSRPWLVTYHHEIY